MNKPYRFCGICGCCYGHWFSSTWHSVFQTMWTNVFHYRNNDRS